MQRTPEYQALLYAIMQDGCPICRLTHERVNRYLDKWKYEMFTDVGSRQQLQRSQGFCHTHTWQLAQMGAALPLALAYRDIITDTIEQLQANSAVSGPGGIWRRFFEHKSTQQACPACQQQDRSEANYIDTLRKALSDASFYRAFTTSQGLCLPHFRLASTTKADTQGEWPRLLRQGQLACLQRLDEQLGEMIRKHDYRFKDEKHGEEMLAWQRAAGMVAGEKEGQ